MFEFELYRLRITGLAPDAVPISQLLEELLAEAPRIQRGRSGWQIGPIEKLDVAGGRYFRFGRSGRKKLEVFDLESGDFEEAYSEHSPYTHIFLDLRLELVAIAIKPKLAPSTNKVAQSLVRVLRQSLTARKNEATIEVEPVVDPNAFIVKLKNAYSIRKLWLPFHRENHFNAHEDFQKPFERLATAIQGEKGEVYIHGKSLNPLVTVELARAAAASGEQIKAGIQSEKGGPISPIPLRSTSPVSITVPEIDQQTQRLGLLERMRLLFSKIRFGPAPEE